MLHILIEQSPLLHSTIQAGSSIRNKDISTSVCTISHFHPFPHFLIPISYFPVPGFTNTPAVLRISKSLWKREAKNVIHYVTSRLLPTWWWPTITCMTQLSCFQTHVWEFDSSIQVLQSFKSSHDGHTRERIVLCRCKDLEILSMK